MCFYGSVIEWCHNIIELIIAELNSVCYLEYDASVVAVIIYAFLLQCIVVLQDYYVSICALFALFSNVGAVQSE